MTDFIGAQLYHVRQIKQAKHHRHIEKKGTVRKDGLFLVQLPA
jgi:hypothetical protein